MTFCTSKSILRGEDLKQFNAIQQHFGWSDGLANAMIGTWQTKNNTSEFPTIEEMKQFESIASKEKAKSTGYTQEMISIRNQAIANGTFMKAPNGNPTNLNERQWLQVRTKAFKDWFGDWENDPANASKIVDENGEPLVVYHGGARNITEFKHSDKPYYHETKEGKILDDSNIAIFFSSDRNVAKFYAGLFGASYYDNYFRTLADNIFAVLEKYKNSDPINAITKEDWLILHKYANELYKTNVPELKDASRKFRNILENSSNTLNSIGFLRQEVGFFINRNMSKILDDTIRNNYIGTNELNKGSIIYELQQGKAETYAAFLNIKNPSVQNYNNEFLDGTSDLGTRMSKQANAALNNGNDGVIYEQLKDPYTADNYGVFNPNQIKSATGNNGEFSKDNADIRYNRNSTLDRTVSNIINNAVMAVIKAPEHLIHHLNGNLYISKGTNVGTTISQQGLINRERLDYARRQKPKVKEALIKEGIPKDAIDFKELDSSIKVNIIFSKVVEYITGLVDKIARNNENVDLASAFGSKVKEVATLLGYLSNKTGLEYSFITYEQAVKLAAKSNASISKDTNAFVLNNHVYFIKGKQLNADIVAEEMLHPFVASIKLIQNEAFNSLLSNAKHAYPRLEKEINATYKENQDEELVTQALSRAFNDDRKYYPEGHPIKELIRSFFQYLKSLFPNKFWNQVYPEEISADMLESNITIDDLARIVNSELKLYSGNISGIRKSEGGIVSEEFYSKTSVNDYIADLVADGIKKEDIKIIHTPVNEKTNEDEYWTVSYTSQERYSQATVEPIFVEESHQGYRERTIKNAKADATIAFAVNFNSAGEILTKKSVISQGKQYIPVDTNNPEITDELVDSIVEKLNAVKAKTLNIAGNGIYTMKGVYTQEQVDEYVYEILSRVLNSPKLKTKIESIRSGGQTGYDEAGIKAAQRLGIRNGVLAPKGWIFRDINGKDIADEKAFKDRFGKAKTEQAEIKKETINTNQEDNFESSTLASRMYQTWNPQTIQYRAIRIARIFRTIITELENQLPAIEKKSTSASTRKYIITERYGTGNILNKVKDRIASTYADINWVQNFVHDLYDEEDWNSEECLQDINHIYEQGRLMLVYFEPLCLEASSEIKKLEAVSILTKDGEVVDLNEEELLDDEEAKTKHEEGWFHELHEQSVEEMLDREITGILSDIYEVDEEGNYTRFDDMEQPVPLDYDFVRVTVNEIVSGCTSDSQMIPALQAAVSKYPWMQQILNSLCGKDTATSKLYQGLSKEEVRMKTLSLQAKFWNGLHTVYVNIAEQVANDEEESGNKSKGPIISRIVNRKEGEDALYRQFEKNCYENKTLFNSNKKPYPSVYRADGSFDQRVYNAIHKKLQDSNIYNRLISGQLLDTDFDLIDEALKSFGVDISIDSIKKLFDFSQGTTPEQIDNIGKLHKVIFGFYAANKASNEPLQSVINPSESANIFDAFNENYKTLASIFGDDTAGFEESTGRLMVDNENKSLFSRIIPNPIHTIINKLRNLDKLSEDAYKERVQNDYGKNWWFAPNRDAEGKGIFRKGILKDLLEIPATRVGLRLKTLKASLGISYSQEIDAQAEETKLNEFENNKRTVSGIEFRDYSVPAFSDTAESYYMSLRYFNTQNAVQRQELISRLADVIRQEIDRINVVEARATKGDAVKPIASFDIRFDKDGNRIYDGTDGSYFHFMPRLNSIKDSFLRKYNALYNNPEEQQKVLNNAIEWAMKQEFEFYLSQYNQWQVNDLPKSQHTEDKKHRAGMIDFINKNTPDNLPQSLKTQLNSIINQLEHNTMTQETFEQLKESVFAIIAYNNDNEQWKNNLWATISSFTLDTTNLDKLTDYFWNSFYANTQIIQLTMRDPAFLGTTDKFQKRMKMFYSPVSTCYTSHYMYDEEGNIQLQDINSEDSLTKETEYSITLKDDEIAQALSYENAKTAIEKRIVDGYLTPQQAKEIIDNLTGVNIADAQCYRTLISWQKCLNMIGKGYNPKMQQAINRLTNPKKYGEWSYEDFNSVWQIFKPFVCSYTTVDSGLSEDPAFNGQFDNIESPVQHKNAEFLLLAMYAQLNGALENNWKLKALNEFMVKHGIDKVQFESAVKVSNQAPIDLNSCTTPEEITATLEGATGLNGEIQAENGDMQVIHSIPFRDWGISTSMPEHLLKHEESSMGTQLLKIIMEGLAENPNKTLIVGNVEKTYAQWLELYQAIHTQNLKDAFSKVSETFNDTRELAAYLKQQIRTQNKYSHQLLAHLELDENGNFKYPIIDPLLRSQFDALCASLVRNKVTKRPFRLGALPQVASWGFDIQLRFQDKKGNLILTEEEFNKKGKVTIGDVTYKSWEDYQEYTKDNCTNLAYMEILVPPFDNNFMGNINDAFVYKETVVDADGTVHKSGEFNMELFNKKVDKKLRQALLNRVPTETKHSMVPAYVKGFLPAQNSSCIVTPGEWIAISDSDNDGDKCYTYFYKSTVIWDINKIKRDYAKSKGFTYQTSKQREYDLYNKNIPISEDRKKSEDLDILYDEMLAGRSPKETAELKVFVDACKGNAEYIDTIKPLAFNRVKLERIEGETDSQYQQRVDLASIASNSVDARNNFMLDLMISVLQTEDNTAQILIPGGFPIIKKVAKEMRELLRIDDNACSICNPAIRTIHQIRNMAGANLIGIYANHRSLRPLMEQANLTLHPNNRPTINGNKSLPRDKGALTWALNVTKNNAKEFISDNISNFSGCSVDNAKDPKLGFLGQNEVTAPISMMLIHTGYTIREVAAFMNQPAIKECVREYLLNGRKGYLEDIVAKHIEERRVLSSKATEDVSIVNELPLDMLDDQISRNAQGILPDANDNLIQLTVLENFSKILPASKAIQNIITVTKADTQVGGLKARSSENKLKIQTMERLAMRVTQSSFPIQGAEDLIPQLYAESDVETAKLPQVAAFRFYGVQSIANFMRNISFTFNSLADEVHDQALDKTDMLSLDKDTIDNLTNATVSYLFSDIGAFNKMSRAATIRKAVSVLNEIKQKRLIKGNTLINDLVVSINGNKYSKRMPFIKLAKNIRKNQMAIENYQRAWEVLLANGDTKIQLKDGTITYKELSDLLLHYCFLTRGLSVGGNSFIQTYPISRIADIEGYNELLKRLSSIRGYMETASTILDQYIANHPEDYHFVHRVDNKKFSMQNVLDNSKVVPSTIKVDAYNLKNAELYMTSTDMYGEQVHKAHPYLYFKDKTGRRYLYKGITTAEGTAIYKRMQVLGNAASGYLEEYEQGKNVIFGDTNSMISILASANSNLVLTSELKNAVDVKRQEAAQKGETLTRDDIRQVIEGLVGSNVHTDVVVDSYESKKEDLTGMEFCVIIS